MLQLLHLCIFLHLETTITGSAEGKIPASTEGSALLLLLVVTDEPKYIPNRFIIEIRSHLEDGEVTQIGPAVDFNTPTDKMDFFVARRAFSASVIDF